MKSLRDPRFIVALILLFLVTAFLGGTLRLIRTARAAAPPDRARAAYSMPRQAGYSESGLASASDTEVPSGATVAPPSADTTGIIALFLVILATIILGTAVGVRGSPAKKKPK